MRIATGTRCPVDHGQCVGHHAGIRGPAQLWTPATFHHRPVTWRAAGQTGQPLAVAPPPPPSSCRIRSGLDPGPVQCVRVERQCQGVLPRRAAADAAVPGRRAGHDTGKRPRRAGRGRSQRRRRRRRASFYGRRQTDRGTATGADAVVLGRAAATGHSESRRCVVPCERTQRRTAGYSR